MANENEAHCAEKLVDSLASACGKGDYAAVEAAKKDLTAFGEVALTPVIAKLMEKFGSKEERLDFARAARSVLVSIGRAAIPELVKLGNDILLGSLVKDILQEIRRSEIEPSGKFGKQERAAAKAAVFLKKC